MKKQTRPTQSWIRLEPDGKRESRQKCDEVMEWGLASFRLCRSTGTEESCCDLEHKVVQLGVEDPGTDWALATGTAATKVVDEHGMESQ
jgi:hypothetical protein